MSPLLSDFVHEALLRGVSRGDIVRGLQQGGWGAKEISTALDAFVESDLPLPVPRKRVSGSPKEAFLFLMLFATLYTAAFALGSMLFDVINLIFPLPGETAQFSIASLRGGIASLVVSFPVFLLMGRVIARETSLNPGQRMAPIRRWLTYLTLFVSAISVITDLITLIVTFLEGDITLRFALKVVVIAALAGSAFLYYLRELRREEIAPSAEPVSTLRARVGFAAMIAVVLAAIVLGLWFAGSPRQARLLAEDEQRVRDLAAIDQRVEQYYLDKGSLPQALADGDTNPGTFVEQKRDRVTGQPYMYRAVDATHFQVGAVFALPSGTGNPMASFGGIGPVFPADTGFWKHGAGPKTFNIDATRKK